MRKSTVYSLQSTVIMLVVLLFASPALASTLSLSPATGTFNQKCNFSLDVLLDTQGAATDGTDAYLNFDSSKFTAGTIDTQGKAYPEYPGTSVDNSQGRVSISGIAQVGKPFTGSGKLATIPFTVKDTASTGATQITFDFDVNNKNSTSDSNVVGTGAVETLSSVTNGSYTVGTGACVGGASPSPIVGLLGRGAPGGIATPSAQPTFIPVKTLPPGGTPEVTATIAIVGVVLTIFGLLGLVLL